MIAGRAFHAPALAVLADRFHFGVEDHFPALAADFGYERGADAGIIGDSFFGNMQGGDARGMRFNFAQLIAIEHANALKAVRGSTLMERVQARHLLLVRRDGEQTADVMGHGMIAAKFHHLADAADRELGFQCSGPVGESTVEDAAIVAALMAANVRFLFRAR